MATVEDYERELLHVQGNYPEDKQRIKDIEAEIAKLKKAKAPPAPPNAGLQAGDRDSEGAIIDGRRTDPPTVVEGNPSAAASEPVEAVGNPKRKTVSRRRRKPAAKKGAKAGPFDKPTAERAVTDPSLTENRG
jgi:hypothetical protein